MANQERIARALELQSYRPATTGIVQPNIRNGGDWVPGDRTVWPRYAAVSPRLLDKLELVVAEIARWHGSADSARLNISIDVHSGFRAPDHNRHVNLSLSRTREACRGTSETH